MSKIRFVCIVEPEESHPRDHFTDPEDVARVLRDDAWNDWAWCMVKVEARFWGFTGGSSYLGGCNYESEEDFRNSRFEITHADGTVTHSGYFDDLCEEAYQDLKEQIENAAGGANPETDADHARAALQALHELMVDQRGHLQVK